MENEKQTDPGQLESLLKQFRLCFSKVSRKLEKQEEELKESSLQLWYQQIGDSLLAISPPLKRGSSEEIITNIHTNAEEMVPLNPKLDSRDNARLYFKKAKRSGKGELLNQKKVEMTRSEMQSFRDIEKQIEEYSKDHDPDYADKLQKRLSEFLSEYIPNLDRVKEKTPFRHYQTEGWDIYVGKTDDQNDELSTRFAAPSDIWFHVAGHAGSHVIIRRTRDKEMPPQNILEQAAAISVWFSKAKHCTYTEVHYTEARYVHKRRGAPAGQVMLDRYKTIRVSPKSPQELFKAPFLE